MNLSRSPKPDPKAVYIAVESYVALGSYESVRRGERVRGDAPVLALGWRDGYFLPDGATEQELGAARQRLVAPAFDALPPEAPATVVKMVRCIARLSFADGYARIPSTGQIQAVVRQVEIGDLLPADAEVVRRNLDAFEPVE